MIQSLYERLLKETQNYHDSELKAILDDETIEPKDLLIGSKHEKTKRVKQNQEARDIIALLDDEGRSPTQEEIAKLKLYTGEGALSGSDDEYYTPEYLATATWDMMGNLGDNALVLDPSAGVGIFGQTKPKNINLKSIELNPMSASINQHVTTDDVIQGSFEEASKEIEDHSLDGVITNVPFGRRDMSLDTSERFKTTTRLETYFILRSLELLKYGKRAVFVVPTGVIESKDRDTKMSILRKASFVGGIRLPNKVFSHTGADVTVDVLIFEKHNKDAYLSIENRDVSPSSMDTIIYGTDHNAQFLNGKYFKGAGKKYTIGHFMSNDEYVASRLFKGGVRGNKTITKDSVEQIKQKLARLSKSKFTNDVSYIMLEMVDGTLITDETAQRKLREKSEAITYFKDLSQKVSERGYATVAELKEFKGRFTALNSDDGAILRIMRNSNALVAMLATANNKEKIDTHSKDLCEAVLLASSVSEEVDTFKAHKKFEKLNGSLSIIANMNNRALFRCHSDVVDSSLYSANIDTLINSARLRINSLWDTDKNKEAEQKDSSRFVTYYDALASKGDLTAEDVVNIEDVAFREDGTLCSFSEIATHGANYLDAVATIENMPFPSELGITREQFEEKKAWMLKRLEVQKKEVALDDIKITNSNAKIIVPESHHATVNDIRLEAIETIDFGYMPTEKLIEAVILDEEDSIERLLSKGVSISSFAKEDTFRRNLKNLHARYGDKILEATGFSDFDALSRELFNRIKNTKAQNLTGVFRSEREIFLQLKPFIIRYIEEAKLELDVLVDTKLKQDADIRNAINSDLKSKATISTLEGGHNHKPLEALKGYVDDWVIETNHGYQNEDIRHFGTAMNGVMAQDTGLGKTRTIFLGALTSIVNGLASNALVVVPTAVYDKWVMEIKDGAKGTPPMLTEAGLDMVQFIETKGSQKAWASFVKDRSKKIALLPHSTFSTFSFKESTIRGLMGSTKKEIEASGGVIDAPSLIPEFTSKEWAAALKSPKNSIGFFEDGHIQYLIIDEAQNTKNNSSGGKNLKYASSIPSSNYPVRVRVASQIIAKSHGAKKGTVLATATPFTSSPYEIYTILRTAGKLDTIDSFATFRKMFIQHDKREEPMATSPDKYMMVDVFTGLNNLGMLDRYGLDSIIYRSAEEEAKREVNKIDKNALKPDETTIDNVSDSTDDIDIKREDLLDKRGLFKEFLSVVDGGDEEAIAKLSSIIKSKYGLDSKIGEQFLIIQSQAQVFSLTDSLNKLAISEDFADNTMRFNTKGASKEVVDKVIASIRKKKVAYAVIEQVKDNDGEWIEVKGSKKTTLGEYVDNIVPHSLVENDEIVVPMLDEDIAKQIIKEFGENTLLLDIDKFPKYKDLLGNIRAELEEDSKAKQIVFSVSKVGARVIAHFVAHLLKDLKIASPKIMIASDVSNKDKDGDKGAMAVFQEEYNSRSSATVLVFTSKHTTGVDFNKKTRAVHLVDIPYTPDVWHQAKGRGVRQGNVIRNVKVYTYKQAGTLDSAKGRILGVKSAWQEDLKSTDANSIEYNGVDGKAIIEEAMARFGGMPTEEQIDIIMKEKLVQSESEKQKEKDLQLKTYEAEMKRVFDLTTLQRRAEAGVYRAERSARKLYRRELSSGEKNSIDVRTRNGTTFIKNVRKHGVDAMIDSMLHHVEITDYLKGTKEIEELEKEIDALSPRYTEYNKDNNWGATQEMLRALSPNLDDLHKLTPTQEDGYRNLLVSLYDKAKTKIVKTTKELIGSTDALNASIKTVIANTEDPTTKEKLKGVLDGTHVFLTEGRVNSIADKKDLTQYKQWDYNSYFFVEDGYYIGRYSRKHNKLTEEMVNKSTSEWARTEEIKEQIKRATEVREKLIQYEIALKEMDFNSIDLDTLAQDMDSNIELKRKVIKAVFNGEIKGLSHITAFINEVQQGNSNKIKKLDYISDAPQVLIGRDFELFLINAKLSSELKGSGGWGGVDVTFTKRNFRPYFTKDGKEKSATTGWKISRNSPILTQKADR